MAEAANRSKRSIINISANLRMLDDVRASLIPGSRPHVITPIMLEALCDYLLEKPDLYLDEMAEFLYDEFDVLVSRYTISRALRSHGWSQKVARRIAQVRNADLRDYYLYQLSDFRSYHLVYIDELGVLNDIEYSLGFYTNLILLGIIKKRGFKADFNNLTIISK